MSEQAARSANVETQQDVFITRLFDAPREQVFQAWLDPAGLTRWFAPHGCQIAYKSIDTSPGGAYHSCITTPDGYQCWCRGVYREIVPSERIVLTMAVANAQGDLIDPTEAGMVPEWPRETVVTVTFSEDNGKTRLTLHQTVSEALAKQTGAHPSWLQMLDRLADNLAIA